MATKRSAAKTPLESLLFQLEGLKTSYALYENLAKEAEARGDTKEATKYRKTLAGVRKGIEKWMAATFG